MKKVLTAMLLISIMTFAMNFIAIAATAEAVEPFAEDATRTVVVQQPAVTIDLTGIILAIMATLSAIVAKYLIPLIKTERNRKLAVIAVSAAEQMFTTGVIDDKLKYAEQWLIDHGVKVDTRALVEAAVADLNKYKKELEYQSEFLNPPDYDEFDHVDDGAYADDPDEDLPVCGEDGCNIQEHQEEAKEEE